MQQIGMNPMTESNPTKSQQVARAAITFQQQSTGYLPKSATAVLNEDTLVVTLHGALTPAEMALARNPAGFAQVQQYHQRLFADACEPLRQEIQRITGVEVREAVAEVGATIGTVLQVFASGTIVQVYLLAHGVSTEVWNGQPSEEA
jgi:uncharacterized protein YbcI